MNFIAKWIGSVERRFRSTTDQEDTGNDTETPPRDESRSSLFYCPDCTTVYIDTDKNTCLTCDTPVDQIQSTLAKTV